jgi:hypothetical protein
MAYAEEKTRTARNLIIVTVVLGVICIVFTIVVIKPVDVMPFHLRRYN